MHFGKSSENLVQHKSGQYHVDAAQQKIYVHPRAYLILHDCIYKELVLFGFWAYAF